MSVERADTTEIKSYYFSLQSLITDYWKQRIFEL